MKYMFTAIMLLNIAYCQTSPDSVNNKPVTDSSFIIRISIAQDTVRAILLVADTADKISPAKVEWLRGFAVRRYPLMHTEADRIPIAFLDKNKNPVKLLVVAHQLIK